MKKILANAFSYLFLAVLVYFMRYLLSPIFPQLEKVLVKWASNINNILQINLNPKILAFILAFICFVLLYAFLTGVASKTRSKIGVVRDNIDPTVRYKSGHFTAIKLIFIIIFVPLIYGYGKALIRLFNSFSLENKSITFFILGFIIFLVVWVLFFRKIKFLEVFEHELTHLIFALCFFHKPKAFYASELDGGWVKLVGSNFIITLAPYFFLTLCFLLLPFYLFIKPEFYNYYFLLMGVFTSYHTFSTIREINFTSQPDILFNGRIFSFIVILLGNIFCYGFILAFVMGGFVKVGEFIQNGCKGTVSLIPMIK